MVFPLRKIIDFAMVRPDEVNRAYVEFFGTLPFEELKTEWEEMFREWLIFDYFRENGVSFLTEYVLKNPDKLGTAEIDQLQQIAKTHFYSLFEIQEIKGGEWFILEDIYTEKTYKVYEKKGTLALKEVGTIPGRIAKVDNCWYLVEANSVYYPITYTQRFKKNLRKMKNADFSPKDTVELLRQKENESSVFPPKVTPGQIKNKRKQLRIGYEKKVKQYQLKLTFEGLIKEINEEKGENVIDFWMGLIKKGLTEKFIFEEVGILEDVWNYFPHKSLHCLSPVEMYTKLKE